MFRLKLQFSLFLKMVYNFYLIQKAENRYASHAVKALKLHYRENKTVG